MAKYINLEPPKVVLPKNLNKKTIYHSRGIPKISPKIVVCLRCEEKFNSVNGYRLCENCRSKNNSLSDFGCNSFRSVGRRG